MPRLVSALKRFAREESGQAATEYVLGVAVIAVGIAMAFLYMQDSTRGIFNNARQNLELPYP